MPQYLVRLRPSRTAMLSDGPTEAEVRAIDAHFSHLSALTASGTVLMAGRTLTTDEHAFGVVLLVAEDEAEARAVVDADPAVRAGVMSAELFPYRVALWSAAGPRGS